MPEDGKPPKQERDPRRRALGEAIKAGRVFWRYSSQEKFAKAAKISERSVASAETGDYVGPKTLTAIEIALDWPPGTATDYLNGNDDALAVLRARGSGITSTISKRLADAGLTMDVVLAPANVAWLQDMRTRLRADVIFFEVIEQISRPADIARVPPSKTT